MKPSRSEGFEVALLGDFNSHGGDSQNLGFVGNPYGMNPNGDFLNDFFE